MSQLFDHLVLGFLVQFLNESVDSLHLLDSGGILFCRLLNSQLDFILLQFVSVILDESFLFLSDVLLLLNCEFLLSLVLDGLNSLITMSSNELDHGSEDLGSF